MNYKIIYIGLIAAMAIQMSCTKVLPFEDSFESMLTVDGSLRMDNDTHLVVLGHSYSPLEDDYEYQMDELLNATALVKVNGITQNSTFEFTKSLSNNESAYQLITPGITLQNYDALELSVGHPGYTTTKASSTAIRPCSNFSVSLGEQGEDSLFYREFVVSFDEPAGSEDYYMFDFGQLSYSVLSEDPSLIKSQPNGFTDEGGSSYILSGVAISDALFDGKKISWTLKMFKWDWDYWENYPQYNKFTFSKISKAEYEFSRAKYLQSRSDPAFEEPVVLPNNIKNGLGVFGASFTYDIPFPG
jgi:hypothetical protein